MIPCFDSKIGSEITARANQLLGKTIAAQGLDSILTKYRLSNKFSSSPRKNVLTAKSRVLKSAQNRPQSLFYGRIAPARFFAANEQNSAVLRSNRLVHHAAWG